MRGDDDLDANLDTVLVGGREEKVVEIVVYDPAWVAKFDVERSHITADLGGRARSIEHIGSTAVANLAAKPIVDIMVTVDNPDVEEDYRESLEAAGYVLRVREAGHRMFRTPAGDVHLHLWKAGSEDEARHLVFRDWLRTHPDDRHAYEELKRSLAGLWPDVNYYAREKGLFIESIVAGAREELMTNAGPRAALRRFVELGFRQLSHPSGPLARGVAHQFNRANREIISRTVNTLNPQPGDSVLDVGFGGGLGLRLLLERNLAGRTAGTDASPDICTRAKRTFPEAIADERLVLRQGAAKFLPWEDESFDGVISTNSLHCWNDALRGLEEILRVLKPGGTLVIGLALRPAFGSLVGRDPALDLARGDRLGSLFESAGFAAVRAEHPAIPRRTVALAIGRRP